MPAFAQPQVGRLLEAEHGQPHAERQPAPRPASRCVSRRRDGGMSAMTVSTRAITATGMLIQKIARQVHWVR